MIPSLTLVLLTHWKASFRAVCALVFFLLSPGALEAVEYSSSVPSGTTTLSGSVANMWIPDSMEEPTKRPVRGLIITTRRGDGKNVYLDAEFRKIAEKHDFALIHVTDDYSASAGGYTDASVLVEHVATHFSRSELQGSGITGTGGTLPVVWAGVSADGQGATYEGYYAYDTTIAVLNYRGRFRDGNGVPVPTFGIPIRTNVPVLEIMSYNDGNQNRTGCIDLNCRNSARGERMAPWSSVLQYDAGHASIGNANYTAMWLDAVIAHRVPAGTFNARSNPLNAPDEGAAARGGRYALLGHPGDPYATATYSSTGGPYSFDSPAIIASYNAQSTDVWLPNHYIAELWLASNFSYTLTYTAGTGGRVNVSSQTVRGTYHAPAAITATAAGSPFVNWTVDGVEYAVTETIQPQYVRDNINFVANFGGNVSPTAVINAAPTSGDAPLAVSFSGNGSSDSDGTINKYAWDFGDGAHGTGAMTSHTYNPGKYTAILTVTDNDGATDLITVMVSATDDSGSTYTLTYSADANGTISGPSPQTVNAGSDGTTVTAVPNGGYAFVNWSDGTTAASRTDGNVNSNSSVTANFQLISAPSGLVLRYSMDDAAQPFFDDSGNHHNGTATGSPAWTAAGQLAGAASFDGASDSVDCGTTPGSADEITVAFWMKANTVAYMIPIDKHPDNAGGVGWTIKLRNDGGIWVVVGSGSSNNSSTRAAAGSYAVDTWVHVAWTFAKGNSTLYINGAVASTKANIMQTVNETETTLRLGIASAVADNEKFNGTIDDVRIYNHALTAQQVAYVYTGSDSDADSDGMPDRWETTYGLNIGINDAARDMDLDGLSNYGEYRAGTDPTNNASVFSIEPQVRSNTAVTDFVIRWNSVPSKRYNLHRSTNLRSDWSVIESNLPATAPVNTATGAMSSAASEYYRVEVQ